MTDKLLAILKSKPRAFALVAVLAVVILTAASYQIKRKLDQLSHLETSIESASRLARGAASEIEELRTTIEEMKSEIENLQNERQAP